MLLVINRMATMLLVINRMDTMLLVINRMDTMLLVINRMDTLVLVMNAIAKTTRVIHRMGISLVIGAATTASWYLPSQVQDVPASTNSS